MWWIILVSISTKKLLFDDNINLKSVGEFTHNYFPKPIYRYRKFDNYWYDNLINGNIHMSKSSTLNDPFDCLIWIDEDIYFQNIKTQVENSSLSLNQKEYILKIKQILNL